MAYTKVTLWIPTSNYHPRGWPEMMTWWNMKTPGNRKMDLIPGRARAHSISFAWNDAVKVFLDSTDDVLFCMHDDIIAHPDTLMRLLSWDKPLVTALTFMKQSPVIPHIWKSYADNRQGPYAMRIEDTFQWFMDHKDAAIKFYPYVLEPRPDDALVDIDFTSMGCTVIRRELLEAMRPYVKDEWFKWDEIEGGGEDRRFHETARGIGMPGYVDRSCVVGHAVGEIATSAADFVAWYSVSKYNGTGEPEEVRKEIHNG